MDALHQVRAVALTDYATVAASVGLDPVEMLSRAGLSAAQLADPETRLAATSVEELLEESAELSGCEDFAMRMAERRTFQSLGGITSILERRPTLREVVITTIRLKRQLNDVFELDIFDGTDRSFIRVSVLPQFGGRQATDLVTAMTHILLRGASGGGWAPLTVHLSHEAPEETGRFERFFNAPVQFAELTNGFECDRDALDHRCGGNPLMAAAELVSILEVQICALSQSRGSEEAANELSALLADVTNELRNITDGRE